MKYQLFVLLVTVVFLYPPGSTNRVGSNELMGVCAMGLHYLDTGRNHWLEMLENSRKPVAQWYSLQEHLPCSTDSDKIGAHKKASEQSKNRAKVE